MNVCQYSVFQHINIAEHTSKIVKKDNVKLRQYAILIKPSKAGTKIYVSRCRGTHPFLPRGTTFVNSCLLSLTMKPFEMGSTSKGKNLFLEEQILIFNS